MIDEGHHHLSITTGYRQHQLRGPSWAARYDPFGCAALSGSVGNVQSMSELSRTVTVATARTSVHCLVGSFAQQDVVVVATRQLLQASRIHNKKQNSEVTDYLHAPPLREGAANMRAQQGQTRVRLKTIIYHVCHDTWSLLRFPSPPSIAQLTYSFLCLFSANQLEKPSNGKRK